MRLIDADELKKGICAQCTLNGCGCLEKIGAGCDWDSIYHIEHAPTIDPVKHSRWQFVETAMRHEDAVMCKNCFKVYVQKSNVNCPTWRYCPNCGAKMDGGDAGAVD